MDTTFGESDLRVAAHALKRILRINLDLQRQHERLPESTVLFHYTTAEGLKGIVEKNELWANSAYFLNDSAEVTYGCGVLKQVLDDVIGSRASEKDSLAMGLVSDLKEGFEGHLNNSIVAPIYLACFCEDGNLLG